MQHRSENPPALAVGSVNELLDFIGKSSYAVTTGCPPDRHNGLLDRNHYDYSFLDPDRPGSSLYTAQIHGTGADLLRSLETLPARSGEFLDKAKSELAHLEENIVKLSGAIQTDWPDEVSLASKKDQVLALERAIENGEQIATEDWLSELERTAADEAQQQRFWEEDEVKLPDHPGGVRVGI
jgi:hypothetical protein